jgi:hypothetical protein
MNPSDLLVAVSAYAGDLPQVERLLPYYLHHGVTVAMLSPSDAPITKMSDARVQCRWVGEAEHHGPKSLIRHKLFLKELLSFEDKNWFLFNDSDSICLSPQIPSYLFAEPACWSNEVQDINAGPSRLPKIAVQPPYFFHRSVLSALHSVAESGNYPPSFWNESTGAFLQTEAIDHYHMQLSHGSGFPVKNYRDGASFNTETDSDLELMCRHVRVWGRVFIHAIKTPRALQRVVSAYQHRAR